MKRAWSVGIALTLLLVGCSAPRETNEPGTSTTPPIPFATSIPGSSAIQSVHNISREQAVEIASRGLPPAVLERAAVTADIHGWYWEVTFDNISATYDELTPYPIKPPPPGLSGSGATTYAGLYQRIFSTVPLDGSPRRSTGAQRPPRPEPYIGNFEATETARKEITRIYADIGQDVRLPSDPSKWAAISVEAYLRGDIWVVLFWEEGIPEHRWVVTIDAVTNEVQSAGVG